MSQRRNGQPMGELVENVIAAYQPLRENDKKLRNRDLRNAPGRTHSDTVLSPITVRGHYAAIGLGADFAESVARKIGLCLETRGFVAAYAALQAAERDYRDALSTSQQQTEERPLGATSIDCRYIEVLHVHGIRTVAQLRAAKPGVLKRFGARGVAEIHRVLREQSTLGAWTMPAASELQGDWPSDDEDD